MCVRVVTINIGLKEVRDQVLVSYTNNLTPRKPLVLRKK